MKCLIINIQEPAWRRLKRGEQPETLHALEILLSDGFTLNLFDKHLRLVRDNIATVEQLHTCLQER